MPQFSEIIDLAIERQYIAIVGIHHRLMATGGEIDDAEPIVPECYTMFVVNISS